jgi:hypothetical protein
MPADLQWQSFGYGADNTGSQWAASIGKDTLYIIVSDPVVTGQPNAEPGVSGITIKVEPRRLWPVARFTFNLQDENQGRDRFSIVQGSGKEYIVTKIPLNTIWWSEEELHPIRVDVRIQKRDGKNCSWRPNNPVTSRLVFGTDNPADLGWLLFK